jgi:hypothetical protein
LGAQTTHPLGPLAKTAHYQAISYRPARTLGLLIFKSFQPQMMRWTRL